MRFLKCNILNTEELVMMKEKLEELLSEKGFKITHEKVLGKVKGAGAKVVDNHVCFPKDLIKEALASVPKEFILAGLDPKYDLKFPHPEGLFYTRSCTGGMYYYNENEEYHKIKMEEVKELTQLVSYLDHIDYVALPSTTAKDVPGETIDIHTLRTVLEYTKKHIWVQPYEGENVKYLIELAQKRVGGAEELRKRPIISMITCSAPSFGFKDMDMEALYQSCINGVPIQPCSLPAAGANAPVTLQGTALMASAEVMAQIIIAQIISPGLPVIATPLLFSMDMQTTCTVQSPIEVTMGRMLAMQLFEEGYGIPAHSYGTGSDSCILDAQNFIERTSLIQMLALSGASVLGGAGQLEVAKTISPIQLIIDNDIFKMTKRLKKGFVITEDILGYKELMEIKDGESFIALDHTFRHFKDTVKLTTFNRDSKAIWENKGAKSTIELANEVLEQFRKEYISGEVAKDILSTMDKVVEKADKALVIKK